MYLVYVDGSGIPALSNRNRFFCLSGVIINESDWNYIDIKLNEFRSHFAISEIHTRNIYKMEKEFYYLQSQPDLNLKILGELYSIISRLNVTLVSAVIDKPQYQLKHFDDNVEHDAWKFLLERLDMGIADFRRQSQNFWEYGLVIADHSTDNQDEIIRSYLQAVRINGTDFHSIRCIIEEPLFTISKWRNFIQLADATSYCVVQYLLNEPFFVQQFQTIYNKFRHDGTGIINGYGLKIYPNSL